MWGAPPQGCADYAFEQHIQKSLSQVNGRSISLWPQGLLDRNSEISIRKLFIESDRIEAIIGLGRNLFYNSGMESCLVICKVNKTDSQKGKILFINASDLVKKEKTISYLTDEHISKIFQAYRGNSKEKGLFNYVGNEEIIKNNSSLNISLYVNKYVNESDQFNDAFSAWNEASINLQNSISSILGKGV